MPNAGTACPTLSADRVPEHSGHQIARYVIRDIWQRLFSDPEEMARFEAWKAERDARLAGEQSDEA